MLQRILQQLKEPVVVKQPVIVRQVNFYTGWVNVPGIGTGAAYATGEAVGTKFSFEVPKSGTISVAVFLDKDDEGLEMDLVLFTDDFLETADNAAFAVTDNDLKNFLSTITFATFKNFDANQVSTAAALGLDYVAPKRRLWGQFVTRGAPNIAAGNLPQFSLTIRVDE